MKNIARFLFVSLIVFTSCESDDTGTDDEGGSVAFDRGAMLANWADNIIVPSFESFDNATGNLEEKTLQFVQDPTENSLAELRSAFEEGYLQFQTVSAFEIGKAESIDYRAFLNTYPTDTATIQQRIEENNYNLELPSSRDEQGFPALDFLINGLGDNDSEIIGYYTTGPNAATYQDYLKDIVQRINALTGTVASDWKNSFRDDFVENTSSSSTGSVDRFTNDYVMYYEKFLRSGKIGIPAGAFTGNPVPQNAEALYSNGLSKELYLKALETVNNFFNGKHFESGEEGLSYRQYLESLNAVKNGQELESLINSQFSEIEQQATNLNPDLAEQVKNDNTAMLQAFDALQKNVVLFKVDMLQALSVSVDYVDSDGD